MLRQWQSEAVTLALKQYTEGQKHFLVLATPGAGKTIMAAEVAYRLKQKDKIDFILCFSPSLIVAEGIRTTFTKRFNAQFNGGLSAVGSSYTYQNMLYLQDEFWSLLEQYNVLVILDEIHHCSGVDTLNSNAWGEKVLTKIQSKATYTLALTGTPWRSDFMPITLSKYINSDNQIWCDYTYGLAEAVRDRVCRHPHLVLIDSDFRVDGNGEGRKAFSGIADLLKVSSTNYESVITHPDIIKYLLKLGCNKLQKIRKDNPKAAGLVVASSVEHAKYIFNILKVEFGQTATIVTYKHDYPLKEIDKFRNGNQQWIVSVGMISEGTDIPRLQVCCHLSTVKTELYFRQVLGRILRFTNDKNQNAWLFTVAEPTLMEYAKRISQDIPEHSVIIKEDEQVSSFIDRAIKENREVISPPKQSLEALLELNIKNSTLIIENDYITPQIRLHGNFRQRIISVFEGIH
ncbi:diguanylate cyclase [Aliivibrio fischeri]|uniref:DEAD/DEAH box helicase n=1 Tax=Aliivibrio fischeri TaxID=668 RepID=UPI00084C10EF|nr:DEAD/DEAH box helicase family protein [Aliivibrio fischeri]OED54673.1 diguanylate cyclase [Aliivibrio fischeri]